MKILMTASSFSHICSFHLPYIKGLHELGHTVDIACGGEIKEIAYANRLIHLPMEKQMFSRNNFRSSIILRKEIRQNAYDRIIMHTSLAAFFTRLSLIGIKRRPYTINVVHGYLFDERTKKLKALILKTAEYLTMPVTDRILTMNAYDYDWATKHKAAKEIYNIPGMGVPELPEEIYRYPFEDDAFILIYPAEFSKRKNQSFLIRAMEKLPKNVKLVLPGRGELLEDCKKLANNSDRIIFPGHVENISAWLRGADAAVTSSISEGLPFNVMEAMQCGLPVIASGAKGNIDLVQDGVNGFIFNTEDEFIQATLKLLHDKQLRSSMGKNSKAIFKQYALDMVFTQILDRYLR